MTSDRRRMVANFVLWQAGWFACVVGAAYGRPEIGLAVTALAVAVATAMSSRPAVILALALAGAAVGLALETAMLASGQIAYVSPGPVPMLPPLWILALWIGFAINTDELLSWMQGRWLLQLALAGIGAPLAYLAGERLGAMTFFEPRIAGVILFAVLWALAFPALMTIAKRLSASPLAHP